MKTYKPMGTYIKQLRALKGLTQQELATLLGHQDSTRLSRIESGTIPCPIPAFKVLIKQVGANKRTLKELYLDQFRSKFEGGIK